MNKSETRRETLRTFFRNRADKVLAAWEVKRAAGDVVYWRAAVRDVRDGAFVGDKPMNIVSVYKGRNIVGYKFARAH